MSYVSELIPPQPAPPVHVPPLSTSRLIGFFGLALWLLLAAALVYMMVSNWDTDKFVKYGPRYLSGLWVTVSLVSVSVFCGAVLSVPIAFARLSSNRVLNAIAFGYVYVFRGTPLLAQIYLIYYGIGSFREQIDAVGLWWFFREAWYCALLSMTMNTAAYQAEILRGAIQSVPRGQIEGGKSLGLSPWAIFRKIVLPQALIVALRPYGNEIILMIKGSAIVAVVTVLDLMGQTRYTFSRTFDYQSYLWAALFYLAIVEVMRHIWAWAEARLTRHLKR
ncbi:MAG: ABC transporter permease [Allorhizobium sp.]